MNDESLEYECFGGEYRPKVYDQCTVTTSLLTHTHLNCIIGKSFAKRYVALFSCS